MVELKRWSHSAFEMYVGCGEAYRLAKVERVPRRPMLAGPAGSAFHTWCDHKDHGAEIYSSDYAELLEEAVVAEEEKSGFHRKDFTVFGKVDQAKYAELGIEWCQLYMAWRQTVPWQVATGLPEDPSGNTTGIEYELSYLCGTVSERGFIDRIFVDEHGDLIIVDLKTWSRRRKGLQLLGYKLGAETAGIYAKSTCYYEARKGETTAPNEWPNWDMDRLRACYEQAAFQQAEGFYVPRPGDDCFNCTVRQHCLFAI